MADRLVRRLRAAEFVTVTGGDDVIRAKVIALLSRNFDDEAMIEAEAKAEAEKVVRQAPREMRQDLDVRKLELGLKQRLAKAKGFAL